MVGIVEVSPRDGLQNEKRPVSTADKLHLINALVDAGVRRIEATSYVHPARVPQMADAEAVMAGVPRDRGVSWSGLVLNERGAQRAVMQPVRWRRVRREGRRGERVLTSSREAKLLSPLQHPRLEHEVVCPLCQCQI